MRAWPINCTRTRTAEAAASAAAGGGTGEYAAPLEAIENPAQREQAVKIKGAFGEDVARCFVATEWKSRVVALQKIEAQLSALVRSAPDLNHA